MDFNFLNNFSESAESFGKWLFESYAGIAVLVGACLLITFLIAVILEFKTKSKFQDHPVEETKEDAE